MATVADHASHDLALVRQPALPPRSIELIATDEVLAIPPLALDLSRMLPFLRMLGRIRPIGQPRCTDSRDAANESADNEGNARIHIGILAPAGGVA